MHLVAIGVNHTTAPVSLRERLSVSERDVPQMLSRLLEIPLVSEAVVLSTCNRTELYCAVEGETDAAENALVQFLANIGSTGYAALQSHLYSYCDGAAIAHLMNVSSGLDSMILGEYQIIGQVKTAYTAAQHAKSVGSLLNHLFQSALAAGKRVRTDTEISRGAFSVGSAAVELATQIFGESLAGHSVLLLGAGKMSDLTARNLQSRGAPAVFVTNRTYDRAVQLAEQLGDGARAVRYDELPASLVTSDIVICSTAAPHPIVTKSIIETAMRARRNRPLFLIDIAVPRDVESSVGDLDNVYLFNIDDLTRVVDKAHDQRLAIVEGARTIVEACVDEYLAWWRSLDVAPLIVEVRRNLESLCADEIVKLKSRSGSLTDHEIKAAENALQSYMQKVAHSATVAIKGCVGDDGTIAYERLEAIRMAFNVDSRSQHEVGRK